MREFWAKAIINSAASDVFKALIDKNSYPQIDGNFDRVDGNFEQGGTVIMVSKLKHHGFRAQVSLLRAHDVMILESTLPFNLLRRVRTFKVIAKDDQTTEFQLSEIQSGHALGILNYRLPDQSAAFSDFAKGLKKFMESRP